MAERPPGVSIGMPVYNGGSLLGEALEAITHQTLQDLEIVVSDNASTDDTRAIVDAFARRDPRIRYMRNEHNVGAPENFNRAFLASTRRYFKWASYDDLLEPAFVERCVAALEADNLAVLAFARIVAVDTARNVQRALPSQLPATRGSDPIARFNSVATERHGGFPLWGVMRANVLADTHLHQRFPGGDKVLLAEMALRGSFIELQEPLFQLRAHSGRSVASMPSIYLRAGWHAPGSSSRFLLPHWRMARGFLQAVEAAPMSRRDRFRGRRTMLAYVFRNWNWARLLSDGIVVLVPSAWRGFEIARRWMGRRQRARRDARESGA